jgi:hypothetical protein
MAETEYVTKGMDDGAVFTRASEKWGFTAVSPSVTATLTNAAAVSASSTTTVCNTGLAELVTELAAKGIIKTS